jgi:hypothetical protein
LDLRNLNKTDKSKLFYGKKQKFKMMVLNLQLIIQTLMIIWFMESFAPLSSSLSSHIVNLIKTVSKKKRKSTKP